MKQIIIFNENIKVDFGFDIEKVSKQIVKEVMLSEKVNFDISVNISLVTSKKIKTINKVERGIDKVTDVLSFPNVSFKKPANFKVYINKDYIDVSIVDLNTKTVFLGDVLINKEYVKKKSKEYGHSMKREFAFLLTHSMLHLLGYDHMKKNEETIMFKKQEKILERLKITR